MTAPYVLRITYSMLGSYHYFVGMRREKGTTIPQFSPNLKAAKRFGSYQGAEQQRTKLVRYYKRIHFDTAVERLRVVSVADPF